MYDTAVSKDCRFMKENDHRLKSYNEGVLKGANRYQKGLQTMMDSNPRPCFDDVWTKKLQMGHPQFLVHHDPSMAEWNLKCPWLQSHVLFLVSPSVFVMICC